MSSNDRRRFLSQVLVASGAALLAGCDKVVSSESVTGLLSSVDGPTDKAFHALTPEDALSQEFTEADLSPVFKANGSTNPQTPEYLALTANNFADYRLAVGCLVKTPLSLTVDDL